MATTSREEGVAESDAAAFLWAWFLRQGSYKHHRQVRGRPFALFEF